MTYNEFEAKWIGKRIDIDGVYGYQCVDLAKQNMLECQGLPNGAYGNAIDYWTNTHPNVLTKYNRIASNNPQKSDLVVLNGLSGNPYGHIGVSNGQVNSSQCVILEQNGSTGGGSGTGGDAIRTRWIDRSRIAGLLRPKVNHDNMPPDVTPPTPTPTPPPTYKTHTIVWGDTLWDLAITYNTTVDELMRLNPYIKDPNLIYAGNTLKVPA